MQLSIQRLRWVLLAGALLLVAVLAAYIGYGRYRMLSAYQRILARSGVQISRDSNGVTYSQSVGGKKIFTLRAARETSLGDGRWALHDADLLLYTRNADHPDHVYGKEFEYDEKQGVARALGEVFMDLQAPDALAGTGYAGMPAQHGEAGGPATAGSRPAQIIHVRTSGLVYVRKLGVAATDQEVEFDYGGMHCQALGADFNTGQNVLHLLSQVRMDGMEHGQPVHLTAVKGDIDRTADVVNLTQPVMMSAYRRSGDATPEERRASADQAVLELRKDGSIQQAHGMGKVVLSAGTAQVTAGRLDATLSPQTVPQTARLSGNVVLVDTSPQRPMHGMAQQVDALFDAQGALARVTAIGAAASSASLSMVDHADAAAGSHGLERGMQGEKVVALFVAGSRKGSSRLTQLQLSGAAKLRGDSLAGVKAQTGMKVAPAPQGGPPQFKTVQVAADQMQILFAAAGDKQVQPQQLTGTGHTLLEQDAPLGEQEISRGNTLQVLFAPAANAAANPPGTGAGAGKESFSVTSAVQAGQVTIYTRAATRAAAHEQAAAARSGASGEISTGSAQRAVYENPTGSEMGTVTLSGDARLVSGSVSLIAPTVVLEQATGNAEARGGVETTMLNASAAGSGESGESAEAAESKATAKAAEVTHVLSTSATFDHALRLSEFHGSDAAPAKMWQDASQIEAAVLVLDGVRHTFSARPAAAGGLVHAVFAGSPAAKPGSAAAGAARNGQAKAGQAERRPEASERAGTHTAGTHPAGTHAAEGGAANYVRVASPKMDYNDVQRVATFLGGVQIDGTIGEVRGERAVVFLLPAKGAAGTQAGPVNGSLDRVVVSGDVRLEQPGRRGVGDQMLYMAATDSYVLTGAPGHLPHVEDAQQGSVTGTTLLFGGAGSTIVVAGAPGAPKSGQGRVRTETEVRQ